MSNCHYCKQELENGTRCKNESCDIHRMKNLYFKPWDLTKEQIEERLAGIDVQWKSTGTQFLFFVTPETLHEVRSNIEGINRENGSILWDSDIDYVLSSPEEIEQQIRDTWAGPGEPILILSYPTAGSSEVQEGDSLGTDR